MKAQPEPAGNRQQPQVLAATVTFCVGLLVLRVFLGFWMPPPRRAPRLSWDDPLLLLELICIGVTLLYLILRVDEGDFKALFLVSLALFVGEEVLGYLSQVLGFGQVRLFGTLLAFAVAIYCSLALSAAAYGELPSGEAAQRRPWVVACGAILAVSALRAFGGLFGGTWEALQAYLSTAFLAGAVGYLAWVLVRSSRESGPSPVPPSVQAVPEKDLRAASPGRSGKPLSAGDISQEEKGL